MYLSLCILQKFSQLGFQPQSSFQTHFFLSVLFSLSNYDHHHGRVFNLKSTSPPDTQPPCNKAEVQAHCLVILMPCPRPSCCLWRRWLMAKSKNVCEVFTSHIYCALKMYQAHTSGHFMIFSILSSQQPSEVDIISYIVWMRDLRLKEITCLRPPSNYMAEAKVELESDSDSTPLYSFPNLSDH